MTVDEVIASAIQRVAELPDRTSPDDWPEAMLVTADELRVILADALEAAQRAGWQSIEHKPGCPTRLDHVASPKCTCRPAPVPNGRGWEAYMRQCASPKEQR